MGLNSTRNSLELFSSSLLTTFSDIRFWKLTFEVEDPHSLLDLWQHSHDHQKSAISPLVREKVKTLMDFFQTSFSPAASKRVFLSQSSTTIWISPQNKHSVAIWNSWGLFLRGGECLLFTFVQFYRINRTDFTSFGKKWRFLSFGKKWCFFSFGKKWSFLFLLEKMEIWLSFGKIGGLYFFFDSGSF